MEFVIILFLVVGSCLLMYALSASSDQQAQPKKPLQGQRAEVAAVNIYKKIEARPKQSAVEAEIVNLLQQLVCRGELMWVQMSPFDLMMFQDWQSEARAYLGEHLPKVTRTAEMHRLIALMVAVEHKAKAEDRRGYYTMEALAKTFDHYKRVHGFTTMTNPFN